MSVADPRSHQPSSADRIDQMLLSPQFAVDPYPTLRTMRQHAPVHWCEPWQCWIVTRYHDVVQVLSDDEHFSNRDRNFSVSVLEERKGAALKEWERKADGTAVLTLLTADPPDHTRLRQTVSHRFTPRAVERLRHRVGAFVDHLLDGVDPDQQWDINRELAAKVPLYVVPTLLGIDPDTVPWQLGEDTTAIMDLLGVGPRTSYAQNLARRLAEGDTAHLYEPLPLAGLFEAQFDQFLSGEASAEDGDAVVASLAQAYAAGALSKDEAFSFAALTLSAGIDTTRVFLTNTIALLLQNPRACERVREQPDLIKPALEESLRLEPPIQRIPRRLARDLTLSGTPLRAAVDGSPPTVVMAMTAAANRDPDLFPHPDSFDLDRYRTPGAAQHLVFGLGRHSCLGQRLARLEAEVVIERLFARFPGIRLDADALSWLPRHEFRTLEELPVRLA